MALSKDKEPKSEKIYLDTFLLQALSSVISGACGSDFQEIAAKHYTCEALEETSLKAIADFISHGYVDSVGSPLSLQESLDLYEAAHALGIDSFYYETKDH